MKALDVVIVGAGPAGLFAANKLVGSGLSILIIDKGKAVDKRVAGIEGVGGAGAFTDGKLNLTAKGIGGDLTLLGNNLEAVERLIGKVDSLFSSFGAKGQYSGTNEQALLGLRLRALDVGIEFISARQKHIGTTGIRQATQEFYLSLVERGVDFLLESMVETVELNDKKPGFIIILGKQRIKTRYLILAPGRAGTQWLRATMAALGVNPSFGPIDIGIRLEFPYEIYEPIRKIMYDAKFKIRTSTGYVVRTFCTNPQGFVTEERRQDFVLVNGHADPDEQTRLTNFALLCRLGLTWPLTDTNEFGRKTAIKCTDLGGGKPLAQRLTDLRPPQLRRSTQERISDLPFSPTLKEFTPGNIGLGIDYVVMMSLLEGIERLSKIMPGLQYGEQVLLYAPEVKFYSDRHQLSASLEVESIPNLFIAGDASGHTEGIAQAAASGMLAGISIKAKEGIA